jgi:TraB/PrgY/gumN family
MFLIGIAIVGEPTFGAGAPSLENDLEVVLVSGEQPGPALWKVSSDTHDLWILGEVTPAPRRLKWRSKQFEALLATSQEVILHDSGHFDQGRQAAQLTAAFELSDGQSLRNLMSPELYARVDAVAKIYGVNEPLDTLSPAVVATRLANASLKALDLRAFPLQISVAKLARRAKVRIATYSTWNPATEIPFEQRLQTVKDNAMAVCPLERIVQVLEDGGTGLRSLANAWAVGDIDAMRRLVPEYGLFTDGFRSSACLGAVYDGQRNFDEFVARRTAAWLAEAERALRENQSTLAVVPIPELLATDGYLAGLRARGYQVVEPD